MKAILKGFAGMLAGTLLLLCLVFIDRLAFVGLLPGESSRAPSSQGIVLQPEVSNLALVVMCALTVYCTGAMALRRDGHRLTEGFLPMALAFASLLPVMLFAFAVTLLRG